MSDSPLPSDTLRFSDAEIDTLARTADAMSAWMGKPVLAQVVDASETGFEWVLFAVPLLPRQDASDLTVVQVGGPNTRIIGSQGGLQLVPGEIYDCEYLWAIQLADLPGVRFIKVDETGEEVAWTNELTEIIPFDLSETWVNEAADEDDDFDDDTDIDGDDDESDDRYFSVDQPFKGPGPTLH